jgi:thiamine biosynthesis lipoprotein
VNDHTGKRAGPQVVHQLIEVMGTVVTVDLFCSAGVGSSEAAVPLAKARAILQRADSLFSTWKNNSPMSRLRRGEISVADAPPEMVEVLERCAEAREISGGWFDPWAMPGGVDPTGYVKGWAAQRAIGAFAAMAIDGALVNAAGDIASFGGPAGERNFRVGIADPLAPHQLACVVDLAGALATSGAYERGAHLINPHTGLPSALMASASVSGPDLGLADALATAVAVGGVDALARLESIDGYEALGITFDGSRLLTSGFVLQPVPELR